MCDDNRFNGTALLEKIRGKRMVFVGDSLNRNQWTSMLCLIESSLNQSSPKSVVRKDNLFILEATVSSLQSHFCVVFCIQSVGLPNPLLKVCKTKNKGLWGRDFN